jgi:hypothetical protein
MAKGTIPELGTGCLKGAKLLHARSQSDCRHRPGRFAGHCKDPHPSMRCSSSQVAFVCCLIQNKRVVSTHTCTEVSIRMPRAIPQEPQEDAPHQNVASAKHSKIVFFSGAKPNKRQRLLIKILSSLRTHQIQGCRQPCVLKTSVSIPGAGYCLSFPWANMNESLAPALTSGGPTKFERNQGDPAVQARRCPSSWLGARCVECH